MTDKLNSLELDFTEIETPFQANNEQDWDPPIRKYFGKKDERGRMIKEPLYVHQEYPRMVYALRDKKIVAKIVQSEEALLALGEGWEKSPAAFGYIGAPSFDQANQLRTERAEQTEAEESAATKRLADQLLIAAGQKEPESKKLGRPPKAQ